MGIHYFTKNKFLRSLKIHNEILCGTVRVSFDKQPYQSRLLVFLMLSFFRENPNQNRSGVHTYKPYG